MRYHQLINEGVFRQPFRLILLRGARNIEDETVRDHVRGWLDTVFTEDDPGFDVTKGARSESFSKKEIAAMAGAIHKIADQHMREFIAHWSYDIVGQWLANEDSWIALCTTGSFPKPPKGAPTYRPRPFRTFEKLFIPIERPPPNGTWQWQEEEIPPGTDQNHIWSITYDADGRAADVIRPGRHWRDVHSFIITERPWGPAEESGNGFYF